MIFLLETQGVELAEFQVYKSYLKAWRLVLDADNSNRCTWPEFQAACRKIGCLDHVMEAGETVI